VLTLIYILLIASAVCFLAGGVNRVIRHKEGTMWWRGAIGLLAFACALMLLEIYLHITRQRLP
jgi:uncharacterized membrane protein YidH (DUF202 family)